MSTTASVDDDDNDPPLLPPPSPPRPSSAVLCVMYGMVWYGIWYAMAHAHAHHGDHHWFQRHKIRLQDLNHFRVYYYYLFIPDTLIQHATKRCVVVKEWLGVEALECRAALPALAPKWKAEGGGKATATLGEKRKVSSQLFCLDQHSTQRLVLLFTHTNNDRSRKKSLSWTLSQEGVSTTQSTLPHAMMLLPHAMLLLQKGQAQRWRQRRRRPTRRPRPCRRWRPHSLQYTAL